MTNQDIKFTVIIPTRERADTLKWTLKTCTTQDYDNLEIIVSDNFSQDDTRTVVESYQDKRIKYINTGKRVSMSSNWEYALSQVEIDPQRYVTFVGDDDGLIPNALRDLNELIQNLGDVEAIAWRKAQYTWGNCIVSPNKLSLSLTKRIDRLDTKLTLQKLLNFDPNQNHLPYEELPCLYNAFVKTTKIAEVRRKSKQFFHSMTPDVYSAIAFSSVINYHYLSNQPYSVNGASKHSNGTSAIAGKSKEDKQAALKFISEIDIPFHPDLVLCPSIAIVIAESLLQARDHLNLDFIVDFNKIIERSLKQAKYSNPLNRREIADAVDVIATKHNIDRATYVGRTDTKIIEKIKMLFFRQLKDFLVNNYVFMPLYLLARYNVLLIDGKLARLHNIYDATILTARILRFFH
jgi:glycosyltransferase involved in cell wall biosynthesis